MNRKAFYLTLGLLVVVNSVVLLGVARNRSGQPDAQVTLTERELPLSWSFRREENSGVSLHLNVNNDREMQEWFDKDKLAELGFDIRYNREGDRWRVHRELPKKAFVVLEYAGEAWQRYRQHQLGEIEGLPEKIREGSLESEEAENRKKEKLFHLSVASRLFAVDAGADPNRLRQGYPDQSRYLILPARVRVAFDWREKDETRLYGQVQEILVDELHVPRRLHGALQSLPQKNRLTPGYTHFNPDDPARVSYRVQVAVGRRLEPWVTEIQLVDGE